MTDDMRFPSPDDPAGAPVWENYIVAQVTQASLGLIPRSTLAVGVQVDGSNVALHFEVFEFTEHDVVDMNDIVGALEALLGDAITVSHAHDVREEREVSPRAEVRWTFLAR